MQTVGHTSDCMANLNIVVTRNKACQEIQLGCASQSALWLSLNTINRGCETLLLLLLYLSHSYRAFTIIYLKQPLFIVYTELQLFCIYNLWYM